MSDHFHQIVIAGTGIGGLVLALCLARAGFDVRVLEQATALDEVGAGVQISANGSRVLHHLGLKDQLDAVAFTPQSGEVRHWQTGAVLAERPLGDASVARFGFPYYHLHRADLHRVLADALAARTPKAVHLATQATGFSQTSEGVRVTTQAGDTIASAVLVGFDGIHSAVRSGLFGPDKPRFTGCVAWRATIPTDRPPAGRPCPPGRLQLDRKGRSFRALLSAPRRAGELRRCVRAQ